MGADAILLIAAALDLATMQRVQKAIAQDLGMGVLVEVHDGEELERGRCKLNLLIGINNRNLRSFEVSLETTIGLLPRIPAGRIVVAGSGMLLARDVARLRQHQVAAFLVGEAFMRRQAQQTLALAGLFDVTGAD